MLMESSLLGVVGHAFGIAVFVNLVDYLIDVAGDVLMHGRDFLQGFADLGCFDLANLSVAVLFFLQEMEMLISNVLKIFHHRSIEIADCFLLDLIAPLHPLHLLLLFNVALFQLPQRRKKSC